ncbi:hypothetical protein [Erythrobacter sp.]|uniref:hypothetical protein n=1 Tax=Erythrobacter sp. TaxID=1042 RepID=UPI0025BD19A5|nr:hypothetical protein [Erythrobacter sp.]
MRLSRRIERYLADGRRLAVAREWEVTFTRGGRGIALAGRQLSARVDAPGDLAPVAQVEEGRSTAGMWPILLAPEGTIFAAGDGLEGNDPAALALRLERVIAEQRLSPAQAERQRAVFAELRGLGRTLLANLPEDLFYPRGEPIRRSGDMTFPGDLTGSFELVYLALPAAGRPWLGEAMREIVTRVGDDERRARESWRMAPA